MTNEVIENRLSDMVSSLSQVLRGLSGRPESYEHPDLVAAGNLIFYIQLSLRVAIQRIAHASGTAGELASELETEIQRLMRLRSEYGSSHEENLRLGCVDTGIELSQQALRGALQFLKQASDRPPVPNDPDVSCAVSSKWWVS